MWQISAIIATQVPVTSDNAAWRYQLRARLINSLKDLNQRTETAIPTMNRFLTNPSPLFPNHLHREGTGNPPFPGTLSLRVDEGARL